jgi:hypothetical protein
MTKYMLIMALVTMIAIPFVSQPLLAQETTFYRNPEAGLNIPYPSDWTVETEKGEYRGHDTYEVTFTPDTGQSLIAIEVLPALVEVDALADQMVEGYMQNEDYQNVKLVDRDRGIVFGGREFSTANLDYDSSFGREGYMLSITGVDDAIYVIKMKGIIDVNGEPWETTPVYVDMLKSSGLSGFGEEPSSAEQSEPEETNEEGSRQVSSNDDDEDEEDNENEGEGDSGESGSSSQKEPQQQNNFQPIPPGQQNLPPAQQSGAGLNDACLKSGFSQEKCNNLLFSDDPGGYCTTLKIAGLDCPKIQDPAFTYGNPEAARQQSEQQIENTERAIQGFEETVPDNLGE